MPTKTKGALHRPPSTVHRRIVALAGGVGGAKLAYGLAQILAPEDLTVIVNTGDDFEHLGLYICPDLDTVCYTLAGLANPETGWGRVNETWNTISNIEKLGGPNWFRLGDQDIATHLERTRRLKGGQSLSQITKDFCKAWGIKHTVLPMTDSPVRTIVDTDEGELAFQEYFVHRRCEPRVKGFRLDGVQVAEPVIGAREAIESAEAIVICPSNPWVSVDPILRIIPLTPAPLPKGEGRRDKGKKVVAVSPIIGGKAVKGPAAKMYSELGIEPSALAVAEHYRGLLSGFVLDSIDAELSMKIAVKTLATDTLMKNLSDRARLATDVLHFIGSL
ncbi:MAG: 2-phospho-L-lactate transferase [Anaerolineales bacterium]|nr:2-phospho-L-lactate transferase [Anaerolineales bacterium]